MLKRLSRIAWAGALASILVGCGGGGAADPQTGGITNDFGPISATSASPTSPPMLYNANGGTYAALFGTQFTDIRVRFPAVTGMNMEAALQNTLIAYTDKGQTMISEYGTGVTWPLTLDIPTTTISTEPTISGLGTKIATVEPDPVSGRRQLFVYNINGSGRTRLTATTDANVGMPDFSPDGTKIVFVSTVAATGFSRILSVPSGGGTATALTTASANPVRYPKWSPNGAKIAFQKELPGESNEIWTMNASGTSPTNHGAVWGFGCQGLDWLGSTGNDLVFQVGGAAGNLVYKFNIPANHLAAAPGDMRWGPPSGAPFGNKMIYQLWDSPFGLTVSAADGSGASTYRTGDFKYSPHWGPYVSYRILVGAGGGLASSSGGFLFAYSGDKVLGTVAFDATTRSTLNVSHPTGSEYASATVFAITCDQMKLLAYSNHLFAPATTVINPLTATTYTNGALVAFDATHKVSMVTTYLTPGATPRIEKRRGGAVVVGKFAGVYDAKGKNLAPQGATEIEIDAKSGAPLAVR